MREISKHAKTHGVYFLRKSSSRISAPKHARATICQPTPAGRQLWSNMPLPCFSPQIPATVYTGQSSTFNLLAMATALWAQQAVEGFFSKA